MTVEDSSGRIDQKTLENMTEMLRAQLAASGKYIVIDKSRQKEKLTALIKGEKKESYKECYDKSCQIPLGQALSADSILRSTISCLGANCMMSAEIVDLAKEATIAGAYEKFKNDPDDIMRALTVLVQKLVSGEQPTISNSSEEVPAPKEVKTSSAAPARPVSQKQTIERKESSVSKEDLNRTNTTIVQAAFFVDIAPGLGALVELGRFRWQNFQLSTAYIAFGVNSEGFKSNENYGSMNLNWQVGVAGIGYKIHWGADSAWEFGFLSYPLSLGQFMDYAPRGGDPDMPFYSSVGLFYQKIYIRYNISSFHVEFGAHAPIIWARPYEELKFDENELYEDILPPILFYVGGGY
jgi:hypothetical protein